MKSTSKFDALFESMFDNVGNLSNMSLMPASPIVISTELDPLDSQEDVDDIAEEMSELEIAEEIIDNVKKLRKKVGEPGYYRLRKIQKLAEKLLDAHSAEEINVSDED